MKTRRSRKLTRVSGAALALLASFLHVAEAAPQTSLETAWRQALALARVEARGLVRPEVVFEADASGRPGHMVAEYIPFANEVRIYQSRRVPTHHLLVHEFLHAIFHQTHAATISLAELAMEDPSEPWVQQRMARAGAL